MDEKPIVDISIENLESIKDLSRRVGRPPKGVKQDEWREATQKLLQRALVKLASRLENEANKLPIQQVAVPLGIIYDKLHRADEIRTPTSSSLAINGITREQMLKALRGDGPELEAVIVPRGTIEEKTKAKG